MPELSWRSSGNRILLDLLVLPPGDQSNLSSVRARALLDTGATVTGIGPGIVAALGLESHTKKRLKSATEERFVDYYLFRIGLVGAPLDDISGASLLPFVFDDSDGFSWGRAADFDVILGMDVLKQCDLHLRRDGSCSLRYGWT